MPSENETAARVRGVLDIPLNRFLGMELRDPADPAAGVWFPVAGPAQNQAAVLHGGVVTTLLDTACYLALLPHLSDDEHAVTHDLTVSLLRPVAADKRVDITGTRAAPRPGGRVPPRGGDRRRRGRRRRPGHEERRPPALSRSLPITRATSTG